MSCMGQMVVEILFPNGKGASDGTEVLIVAFAGHGKVFPALLSFS